ncbi:hypothetical protein [Anaerococcus hydrogenalis]|uniref:Uncharacterized protein n=1 Tax=Anaerococcus hydrogenalis TaxID=33029 RepID=A0A2N6UL16_9FIRM|nr:hypothetical protein [Anaerococcus hydrogenalis]MDK7694452.1 hypothetical protein [Anaerococcus hydrogenalis]MDK7696230.1 hypothetical protein [Anaerococcus hydrogenalis]MDK7707479.1 hypothetical protein [Anaerococcus hydrogenalis]PMC82494.1 hypothetical protein CJ192_01830 [Anaerococcus hydrogenalis]
MDEIKYNIKALTDNIDTLGTDVLALKDLLFVQGTIEDGKRLVLSRDVRTNFDYIINITVDRIKDEVEDLETIIYDLARSQKIFTDQGEIENKPQAINEGIQ